MHSPQPVCLPVARQSGATFAHCALPVLFAMFGMIMGSWAGRIPALRDGVQVSHSVLSTILLCGGLGAVLSFPLSSRMMNRFGGRKTLLVSGGALLAVLVGIGAAPNVPLLMLAVLSLGITASVFDVAINSIATAVEQQSGKSVLARLHAWGCAGGLAGATLGSVFAGLQIAPARHFLLVATVMGVVLWIGHGWLAGEQHRTQAEKKKFALPRGPWALLGALGFFGAIAEGSIADWSGVFMKDHFGVSDGFAPLALSAFSVMMLLARLTGDRLKGVHGARKLVTGGGLLAAAGLMLAVLAPGASIAIGGFALAGIGMALVFPFIFSAAGKGGPAALAGVATMAYSGSLMGPPLLGALAHGLGLQVAMAFIAMLSLVIAAVASRTALLQ